MDTNHWLNVFLVWVCLSFAQQCVWHRPLVVLPTLARFHLSSLFSARLGH